MIQKNRETGTKKVETTEEDESRVKAAQEAGRAATEATAEIQEQTDETVGQIEDILDEIDGVLEENAQEFVAAYVQKGGE